MVAEALTKTPCDSSALWATTAVGSTIVANFKLPISKASAAHLFRAAGEAGPKIIGVFKQTSLTRLGRFRSAPPRLSIEEIIMKLYLKINLFK